MRNHSTKILWPRIFAHQKLSSYTKIVQKKMNQKSYQKLLQNAIDEAKKGLQEGGIPIPRASQQSGKIRISGLNPAATDYFVRI